MSLKAGHVSKFHADCSGSSRNTNLNKNRITSENIDKHSLGLKFGITCIVCGETNFECWDALAEHRSQTHKYKCPDCDKVYKLSKDIRKHNRQAHIENVKMTCCKFCDKVFHDSSLKTGHISTFHADLECSTNNEIKIKEEMGNANEIQIKEETEISNELPIKAQMGSIKAGTIE